MTKPSYHEGSVQSTRPSLHYLQIGGFDQLPQWSGPTGWCGEVGAAARVHCARSELGKRAGRIPPPGYSVIHARLRTCCGTASHPRTETLLFFADPWSEPSRWFSRPGHSKISRPARVTRERGPPAVA